MTQWGHSLQIWKSGTLSPLDELMMSADQLGFHSCASLHIEYPVNNWMISIIHMVLYNKAGTPVTASESQPYSLPLLYNILLSKPRYLRVSNYEFSFRLITQFPSPCLPSKVLCVLSGWVHFSFPLQSLPVSLYRCKKALLHSNSLFLNLCYNIIFTLHVQGLHIQCGQHFKVET